MAGIRYGGTNGEPLTTADVRQIAETNTEGSPDFDGDGRVFELLGLFIPNIDASTRARVRLYDADEATTVTSNRRVGFQIIIPPNDSVTLEFARGSGPRFRTNITADLVSSGGNVPVKGVRTDGVLL